MTLARTLAVTFALLPGAALADVTPQDVWDNMTNAYAAGGMALLGTPVASGGDLSISDAVLQVTYPIVGGTARLTLPEMTFADQGDGTVRIVTPETYAMDLTADVPQGDGPITASLVVAQSDVMSIASGEPGDVIYTTTAGQMDFLVNNLVVPGEDFEFVLELSSAGYEAKTQVTEGENLTVTSDILNGEATSQLSMGAYGARQDTTSQGGTLRTVSTIVLPPDMNILDLTPALLAGLSVDFSTQAEGSSSSSQTFVNDEPTTTQEQTTGPSQADFKLNADGMTVSGTSESFSVNLMDPELMPFPIAATGGAVTADFALPMVASDAPQTFKYAFSLSDIEIANDLWDIFDQSGKLDRSPASLAMDATGNFNWGLNTLNFAELAALEDADMMPFQLTDVSLNNLAISALGAAAQATGAFTFDLNDMETIPGFARPEGQATITASGINAAIDQLVAAGFVPEEDAMMPRMMMGMFARVVGDDQLETVVEVNPEGHVIVNGQRMR